jgi:hypothetical protein
MENKLSFDQIFLVYKFIETPLSIITEGMNQKNF